VRKLFLSISISFISIISFAQTAKTLDAASILQNAQQKAKQEKKKIFLKFTASWCGWCHKMDAAMKDSSTTKLFNNNYVITHLTVMEMGAKKTLENSGGLELMNKYGGTNQGLPYWVVLDEKGTLLANSLIKGDEEGLDSPKGNNAGCPASENEIPYFIRVLKNTSKLTNTELEVIEKRFQKIITASH
jgi:thiol-disulfide isomerase/thioredoxin